MALKVSCNTSKRQEVSQPALTDTHTPILAKREERGGGISSCAIIYVYGDFNRLVSYDHCIQRRRLGRTGAVRSRHLSCLTSLSAVRINCCMDYLISEYPFFDQAGGVGKSGEKGELRCVVAPLLQ